MSRSVRLTPSPTPSWSRCSAPGAEDRDRDGVGRASIARRLALGAVAATLLVGACGDEEGADDPDPGGSEPITVEQLVERSADTATPVVGFLHITADGTKLCSMILESYPPQCGGPSVDLVGLVPEDVPDLQSEGDVRWREQLELVVERTDDGAFTVIDVRP
jgi:hypothetical protein